MKRIVFVITLLVCVVCANAQVFVGGSGGVSYSNDVFSLALRPMAGYEFNDRFALGAEAGYTLVDDASYFQVEPFVRFNCWNNSRVFLDVKAKGIIDLSDDDTVYEVGIVPSVRYRLSNRWDVSADLGILGYDSEYENIVFAAKTTNVCLSFIYRF